jgi:hypothetical protein
VAGVVAAARSKARTIFRCFTIITALITTIRHSRLAAQLAAACRCGQVA